ncbi:subtilisin family serine protease [Microbacterium sp. SORGH_AS428]|uniref:hypothetical protein n=1 Tax=Microbacterium sp. SORGH_AS_0428 TaxID=3041788 RepID=UPI0028594C44|nr:hypothetical protein [Microbacterium sp. SORGH_AS_0428]MDR6199544.1 subtilisin family serine protease [Microbacterium sp. SORGH_AS_0428]
MIFGAAAPASAAGDEDGQWWYEAYGVADVHAEGWTGEGVKIAVVDTQINPDLSRLRRHGPDGGRRLCLRGREPVDV